MDLLHSNFNKEFVDSVTSENANTENQSKAEKDNSPHYSPQGESDLIL